MKNEIEEKTQQQIYRCYSLLLEYPKPDLIEKTKTCIELLKQDYSEAAEQMAPFLSSVESTPLGRLEEIYTGTFDINPACHIFAGHILFGESFKRNAFMATLSEEYQKRDFDAGKELVDHIPILLKFISQFQSDDAFVKDLITDCLIPVFQKMNANFKDSSPNPYVPVLRTALVILEGAN